MSGAQGYAGRLGSIETQCTSFLQAGPAHHIHRIEKKPSNRRNPRKKEKPMSCIEAKWITASPQAR
ncbi:hypothetical protein IAQ61_007586 [Plenodomus lingam]|uniref:Predicted protein n=1 Tax=Leptosphaeria maculans (strain JN3 / isolate v23.1.3 / race Av1-4-5-6-7-8) TaxID=985895 RepID=E5A5A0_LEPMJ|nr:predicted protein [Plenodomus lingam JN3]KAH9866995.1 hypothetical protein IAQ61_007586 [Plenodomus lingam]CBX98798.1 predicted protein [Plenodomus lingam JN3]